MSNTVDVADVVKVLELSLELAKALEPVALALIDAIREWVDEWRTSAARKQELVATMTAEKLQRSVERGEIRDAFDNKFTWDVALQPALRAFVEKLMAEGR